MKITFTPLSFNHFPLLLKWLTAPHVHRWWAPEVNWTLELIQNKYYTYVEGYKVENSTKKAISAYVIYTNEIPVGYIQVYNAYDFQRSKPLIGLPKYLAAFDIFIGEASALNQGIATQAMSQFFQEYLPSSYTHIFADPDINNHAAIHTYEKAGFKKIAEHFDTREIWMIKDQITFHPATLGDLNTLNSLMKASKAHWGYDQNFMDRFMQLFGVTEQSLEQSTTLVARIKNQMIGFYQFVIHPDKSLELENIFIHPQHIGQGIGKTLWSHACKTATRLGKTEFTLWSDPHAENFYFKMGCKKIGTKPSPMMPGRYPSIFKYVIGSTQIEKI